MFNKIKTSFNNINHKFFISLLVMGLVPTIYITLRVFLLGNLPNEWSYSIAGQLSWINLIYEIINEAIILPIFYFIGKVCLDKKELTNRIKGGLLTTLGIYILLSVFIMSCTNILLKIMATNPSIIDASAIYIRIEAIANIFGILFQFALVGLLTLGKNKLIYILTSIKLGLYIFLDVFLVSTLSISANLEVNGIGISNIIVNMLLFITTLLLLAKNGVNIFNKEKINYKWIKEFIKVGGMSGLESFVRNLAYMLMIVRMINIVNEQGTYWIANNFIWNWMFLPILQLGELIKQETSINKDAIENNTLGYFTITTITIIIWCILIPIYKPFMKHVLNFTDVDKLFKLVMILFGFYVAFAIQNVFDATFYGLGKTHYMFFETIVTNAIYYIIAFILYITKMWHPTLIGIAILFGGGIMFDSIVSLAAYLFMLKKHNINIFNIKKTKITKLPANIIM